VQHRENQILSRTSEAMRAASTRLFQTASLGATLAFRATAALRQKWPFRCICYLHEIVEAALTYAISDTVAAAYQRGDLFEKRRQLMGEWAKYCNA
jgi:hypothetical protein